MAPGALCRLPGMDRLSARRKHTFGQIGGESFRQSDGAIGSLPILQECRHRPADSQGRGVQGMRIAGTRDPGGLIVHVQATRLERPAVTDRGDLDIPALPGIHASRS